MKNLISSSTVRLLAAVAVSALALNAHAATVVWGGSSGEYTTGTNWVGNSVPNTGAGDTAVINAGAVNYTAGPDLAVNNGGVLQINGGSWTQSGGISWLQLGGGTLNVAGGTFNQGTAGNIVMNGVSSTINVSSGVANFGSLERHPGSVLNITGGTANFTGNIVNDTTNLGSISVAGGALVTTGEFKPLNTFTLTTGNLTANLISFSDGPGTFNLSGGSVSVNGAAAYNGIYGAGGSKTMNFTTGSTASLFFSSITLSAFNATNFLTNGTIQYNGAVDAVQFNAVSSGGGVLVTAVPEPSTYALLLMGLGTVLIYRRRVQS